MLEVSITKKLRNFTLDVNFKTDNNVLALLGSSGSGKSMTLKCIAGVEKPDNGKIILDGEILFDSNQGICLSPQKRRVGLLFQNYALFPMMTVLQNVLCGCHYIPRKIRKERAMYIIEKFGLGGLEKVYPKRLSGGQQQRVALARMIASNPQLLLFDEPFSALDTHLRRQLNKLVSDILKDFGGAAIFVSHDSSEAFRLCPVIAIMEHGKITVHKDRLSLFKNPETITAAQLIGCENILPVRSENNNIIIPSIKTVVEKLDAGMFSAIAITAHDIYPDKSKKYVFCAKLERVIASPYDTMLCVKTDYSSQEILCKMPSDFKIPDIGTQIFLSFDKKDIMFLKDTK